MYFEIQTLGVGVHSYLFEFSIKSGCIKKIPLNPPLQKGEAVGMHRLIEMLLTFRVDLLRGLKREDIHLLQDMDILFLAHVLEDLWPHSDTNLPNMRLF